METFFGMIVKPGEETTNATIPQGCVLQVTQFALPAFATGDSKAKLCVQGARKLTLGTLDASKGVHQQELSLHCGMSPVRFSVEGNSEVHLSGYFQSEFGDDDDDDDDGEDQDDDLLDGDDDDDSTDYTDDEDEEEEDEEHYSGDGYGDDSDYMALHEMERDRRLAEGGDVEELERQLLRRTLMQMRVPEEKIEKILATASYNPNWKEERDDDARTGRHHRDPMASSPPRHKETKEHKARLAYGGKKKDGLSFRDGSAPSGPRTERITREHRNRLVPQLLEDLLRPEYNNILLSKNAAWTLSYLHNGEESRPYSGVDALATSEVINRCIFMFNQYSHSAGNRNDEVQVAALALLATLGTGDGDDLDEVINTIISAPKLEDLVMLLCNEHETARYEAFRLLNQLSAGSEEEQHEWFIESNLLPFCVPALTENEKSHLVKYEALEVFRSLCSKGNAEQFEYLYDRCDFLPHFIKLLDPEHHPEEDSEEGIMASGIMETLSELIDSWCNLVEDNNEEEGDEEYYDPCQVVLGPEHRNLLEKMLKADLLPKLSFLKKHRNPDVCLEASDLIQRCNALGRKHKTLVFPPDRSKELAPPPVVVSVDDFLSAEGDRFWDPPASANTRPNPAKVQSSATYPPAGVKKSEELKRVDDEDDEDADCFLFRNKTCPSRPFSEVRRLPHAKSATAQLRPMLFDPKHMRKTAWVLSHMFSSEEGNGRVEAIASTKILKQCTHIVNNSQDDDELQVAFVALMATICSGTDEKVGTFISTILATLRPERLLPLLQLDFEIPKFEVCRFLANVSWIPLLPPVQWVIEGGLLPHCVPFLRTREFLSGSMDSHHVGNEAKQIFLALSTKATPEQFDYLLHKCKYLPPFVALLDYRHDAELHQVDHAAAVKHEGTFLTDVIESLENLVATWSSTFKVTGESSSSASEDDDDDDEWEDADSEDDDNCTLELGPQHANLMELLLKQDLLARLKHLQRHADANVRKRATGLHATCLKHSKTSVK